MTRAKRASRPERILTVGCISQKGGVGKSSIARLLARECAAAGQAVLLADLDAHQATSLDWARRRVSAKLQPRFNVERCDDVKQAAKLARKMRADCLILDAPGYADSQTLDVAKAADALLIPSGLAIDDLVPAVRLAHELTRAGIDPIHIAIALCRSGDATGEIAEARQFVARAGYTSLNACLPERAGYRRAHDEGRTVTEARHPSLRTKAQAFATSALTFIKGAAHAGSG